MVGNRQNSFVFKVMKHFVFWGAVLAWMVFSVASCVRVYTAHGVYHRIRKGDTLYSISRQYKADFQDVAEDNNIQDPSKIYPGQRIYVSLSKKLRKSGPVAAQIKTEKSGKEKKITKAEKVKKKEKAKSWSQKIEIDRKRFIWPVKGTLSSGFGYRHGRRHDGIDVGAKKGTPIYAAASGKVVFSGRLRGYGNLVLIKHKDSFFTAYAHNSKNLTQKGKSVKRGQVIAKVGNTGRSTGPHLHFEVRKGRKARNPLFFLPKRG